MYSSSLDYYPTDSDYVVHCDISLNIKIVKNIKDLFYHEPSSISVSDGEDNNSKMCDICYHCYDITKMLGFCIHCGTKICRMCASHRALITLDDQFHKSHYIYCSIDCMKEDEEETEDCIDIMTMLHNEQFGHKNNSNGEK